MIPATDYSWVRGVNYGMREPERVRRELGYGNRIGLNAVRIWLSHRDYARDPQGYVARLTEFVRICDECGYQVMPILWNGNMLDPHMLDDEVRAERDAYVSAVVAALKDEPGLLMWDVMNEPTCNNWLDGERDADAKQAKLGRMWDFVRYYCDLVHSLDDKNAVTVGHTFAWDVEPTVECVDVISFHDYSATRALAERAFVMAEELGKKCGKPVIQSETGCLGRANPYDMTLEICERHNMGWFLFNLMIDGWWSTIHGIFYPDGTVRDPATIAAIMGCYRKRGDGIIVPVPNREGAGMRALRQIEAALDERTPDLFAYRQADAGKILEACEAAANLLEGCDLIPMAYPPTAKINIWRAMEAPPLPEIRRFAFELAKTLRDVCEIL